MTPQQKRDLAGLLQYLYRLDRFSSCSDRYFRQVLTQQVRAIQVCGYDKMLLADADAQEPTEPMPQE